VLRTPGRAAVGAVSLAVGVTALTILAAVTFAFRGVVVGSLLVTTTAALLPAQALRRLPAAHLLAEE
jgi:hypothetical protein